MAVIVLIAAAMLIIPGCERKPVMPHSTFVHLPANGWQHTLPVTFSPEYDDSSMTYRLFLAVRHDITYRYRNLSLTVDIFAADSTMTRRLVDLQLADEYGNWKGGGFGSLYQDTVCVTGVIDPLDASKVVVWQTMEGADTLRGIIDLGLITRPIHFLEESDAF